MGILTDYKQLNINFSSFEASKVGLHLISPYIGKIRPALARYLIELYSVKGGIIWDPFCGSGTIPLEGWIHKQQVFATDLNFYAYVLTRAKLFPPENIQFAHNKLERLNKRVMNYVNKINLDSIPQWIKEFYHPLTLSEIILWSDYLKKQKEWFLLSCLLGILHHQRPGFLSFPSSHGAPYLRDKKYPRNLYPEMYDYKNTYELLSKKVERSFKNFPSIDFSIDRKVYLQSSAKRLYGKKRINTIITSPPYMKALTYARDNRLRLWFLGHSDWQSLENKISPNKVDFLLLMQDSFKNWSKHQQAGDICIIIAGDIPLNKNKTETIADLLINLAESNNYKIIDSFTDPIPEKRRVVKGKNGVKVENICVFQRS